MSKLMFALFIALAAAVSGYSQNTPVGNQTRRPSRSADMERQQEMDELYRRRELDTLMNGADAAREEPPRTFKASVVVENRSDKVIKSVSWVVSLLYSNSGELIREYKVTTRTNIAPGKTKTLKQRFPIPRTGVVDARNPSGKPSETTAKIVPVISSVTYEDGSSGTP